MGEALRRSLLVLAVMLAVTGLPALVPDDAPDLRGLLWLRPAAAECAGVDPNHPEVTVNPPECVP